MREATHVRLRGVDTGRQRRHVVARPNLTLQLPPTFFDEQHHRFQEMRVSDKRTRPVIGSRLWERGERQLPTPERHALRQGVVRARHDGQAWFDHVSLEVPAPIDWDTATTKNFVFHWLPGHPMPEGSQPSQQMLFDTFANKLGIKSDIVINYYFYPDTTTIKKMLSLKGYQYVSWDDLEFHSINANDNHEIIPLHDRPHRASAARVRRRHGLLAAGRLQWRAGRGCHAQARARELRPAAAQPARVQSAHVARPGCLPCRARLLSSVSSSTDSGAPKLLELYAAVNGMNSYEAVAMAANKVFGMPFSELETAWRSRETLRASRG